MGVKFSVPLEADLDGLPSHVVDMQGVVRKYGVADCRDVGKGNGVPIPENVSVKKISISISLGKSDWDVSKTKMILLDYASNESVVIG